MRHLLVSLILSLPGAAYAETLAGPSPYAGFEIREIKALSPEDIAELRRGGGWGLALAAELNGAPGPAHLLELREPLGLSPDQVARIEAIFQAMQAEAIPAGEALIEAEAAVEAAFRGGSVSEADLAALIRTAALARADLRLIHLKRHLETPPLLTPEQIALYAELRGYSATDPCASPPEGHDPVMWSKHNGCPTP